MYSAGVDPRYSRPLGFTKSVDESGEEWVSLARPTSRWLLALVPNFVLLVFTLAPSHGTLATQAWNQFRTPWKGCMIGKRLIHFSPCSRYGVHRHDKLFRLCVLSQHRNLLQCRHPDPRFIVFCFQFHHFKHVSYLTTKLKFIAPF